MRNPSKRAKHNKVTVSLTCDWQNMRGGDKGHVIKEEREAIEMKWVGFEGRKDMNIWKNVRGQTPRKEE